MVVGQEQTVQVRSSCTGSWSVINEYPSKTESAIIVSQCKSKYFKIVEGMNKEVSGLLFYSLWFDLTGAQIHDLSHSRRAR
jgi:hypothetical protein